MRESRRQLGVAARQASEECDGPLVSRAQRCLGRMTFRLCRGDLEATSEHLQRALNRRPIDRGLVTDVDGRHERGERVHGADLRLLIGRNELEHAHHLGHARQGGEGALLRPQLRQRIRGGERGESRAARLHDLSLPDDRLHARRLKIEPVVVEADGRQREQCADRQRHGHDEDDQPVAHQPARPRRVVLADRRCRRHDGQPPPRHDQQSRKDRDHGDECHDDGGGGDEAEFLDAPELCQHQHAERAGGGEGSEENPGPGVARSRHEGVPRCPAEPELFLVTQKEVDPVVDAEADEE